MPLENCTPYLILTHTYLIFVSLTVQKISKSYDLFLPEDFWKQCLIHPERLHSAEQRRMDRIRFSFRGAHCPRGSVSQCQNDSQCSSTQSILRSSHSSSCSSGCLT